jgi:hypothetical protein
MSDKMFREFLEFEGRTVGSKTYDELLKEVLVESDELLIIKFAGFLVAKLATVDSLTSAAKMILSHVEDVTG